jgi:ABC-type Fe3+/spermidine/putrescine transport system ATPase subunit
VTSEDAAGHVQIEGLTAGYRDVPVLDVDRLSIRKGEFLSVLGPSGCGKTTLLNCLAGFVTPTAGRITLDGADITGVPAHRRGLGLVFQNYALFPHMSVGDNVAYGLRVRRMPKAEREKRVTEALALVALTDYAGRRPRQLSGGQQQRVAVARALATRPAVLLLDEPLSNLDAKLRRETRMELRALQQRLGITMVFVTHDQEEAMSMSDRIAVMNAGRIERLGTPDSVYHAPGTRFVAEFIGAANVIEGIVGADGTLPAGNGRLPAGGLPAGQPGAIAIRPERIVVTPTGKGDRLTAVVAYRAFVGGAWQVELETAGGPVLTARLPEAPEAGTTVTVHVDPADVIVLDGSAASEGDGRADGDGHAG